MPNSFDLDLNSYKFNSPSNNMTSQSGTIESSSNQKSGSFSRYNKSTYNTTNGGFNSAFYQNYLNNSNR